MKKLAFMTALSTPFLAASTVLADISINAPTTTTNGVTTNVGYSDLGAFISNVMTLAFGLAILVVLVMLIWGAFEWIGSGGDKEAVGKARGRIINALIGLAVLAVAFALATVAAQFLGFNISKIPIPTPQ